jgi:N-acyl-L-homoserine lactone synthetase
MYVVGPDEGKITQKSILDFHRLRKTVFADEYNWDVLTSGPFEFDQYDMPAARYVVAYSGDRCIGGARLLPCDVSFKGTDGQIYTYMLNDFCHGSMAGQFPKSKLNMTLPLTHQAWEMSRFLSTSRDTTKLILDAVDDYLRRAGVSEVITISPLLMPRVLKRLGYETNFISDAVTYGHRSYVALSTSVQAASVGKELAG